MSGPEFVMAMTLMSSGIGLVFFFAVPVRKAMLRKIEGSSQLRDPALEGEVEDLRARLGELEERLDFAERLLARQRDAAELPPGGFQ
jgi:hypothetical protein